MHMVLNPLGGCGYGAESARAICRAYANFIDSQGNEPIPRNGDIDFTVPLFNAFMRRAKPMEKGVLES